VVTETIRDMGLELQVIFNKGAVMILPTGVNKATGLRAALETLQLPAESVVGVGDAENDHAFLEACGFGVAVSNALPSLKKHADHVTEADHGAGVVELIDGMLSGRFDAFSRKKHIR
jgi:hydroxymethylpyrimidine pyrophosphatase-like HAD family hydrolase